MDVQKKKEAVTMSYTLSSETYSTELKWKVCCSRSYEREGNLRNSSLSYVVQMNRNCYYYRPNWNHLCHRCRC